MKAKHVAVLQMFDGLLRVSNELTRRLRNDNPTGYNTGITTGRARGTSGLQSVRHQHTQNVEKTLSSNIICSFSCLVRREANEPSVRSAHVCFTFQVSQQPPKRVLSTLREITYKYNIRGVKALLN